MDPSFLKVVAQDGEDLLRGGGAHREAQEACLGGTSSGGASGGADAQSTTRSSQLRSSGPAGKEGQRRASASYR